MAEGTRLRELSDNMKTIEDRVVKLTSDNAERVEEKLQQLGSDCNERFSMITQQLEAIQRENNQRFEAMQIETTKRSEPMIQESNRRHELLLNRCQSCQSHPVPCPRVSWPLGAPPTTPEKAREPQAIPWEGWPTGG